MRTVGLLFTALAGALLHAQTGVLTGQLHGADGPVPFASVAVVGTGPFAMADAEGRFRLDGVAAGQGVLRATAVGHRPLERTFRMTAGGTTDLGVLHLPAASDELAEVVVSGTLREVARSESPVPVEVIGAALFRRSPAPSLLDAVGMVNGVRPQVNCSVCNTGDIRINGMEGPYTLVLIDGMPIVSGLSTVYGLSGIPTSLIERVEVVKGPGSALYGSEAMGGIINVITKDPVLAPRASADLQTTTWNEHNADLGMRLGHGRIRDLVGVNVFHFDDARDDNGDGFTDMTLQRRLSVFNKMDLQRPGRRLAGLAARFVAEDRWGGQLGWTESDRGSDRVYGERIATRRWELIGQYQLPMKEDVLLQASMNGHDQDSWYGTTRFTANQQVAFAQLRWRRCLGRRHHAMAGAAWRHTVYDDNTTATAGRAVRSPLPGLFLQDEWQLAPDHLLLVGQRSDLDRVHGLVHSPRVAYKWAPNGRWILRGSFGTGFRNVNIFTEDHAALTGARRVLIAKDLRPERSVNGTLNLVRKWPGRRHYLGLDLSLFITRFSNRILPDYDRDPDLIVYENLAGSGHSRGVALNVEARAGQAIRLLAGITWSDAWTEERDPEGRTVREQQLFVSPLSGTFSAEFRLPYHWTADVTGQWFGPMPLPVLPNDPRPDRSPTYLLLNVQVRRPLGDRLELYAGVKNLLDFVPSDPILRPFDPFDRQVDDPASNPHGLTFDTAYMYAPLQGIRGFVGLRFTLAS